jgi:hypothetical protein
MVSWDVVVKCLHGLKHCRVAFAFASDFDFVRQRFSQPYSQQSQPEWQI